MENITHSPTPIELIEALNRTIEQVENIQGQCLGDLVLSYSEEPQEGRVRLDGTEYTAQLFPDFFSLLESDKLKSISSAQWEQEYLANDGNVGKIALDIAARKFKMPRLDASTFIGQAMIGQVGSYVAEGLPNITGKVSEDINYNILGNGKNYQNGALRVTAGLSSGFVAGALAGAIDFDASRSNHIYGNSDTVTPRHIRYPLFMIVANAHVPASQAQYNQFVSALELKMNTDISNVTDAGITNMKNALNIGFTILYPNGGSKEAPANVVANSRYVMSNPFGPAQVICLAEVLHKGQWGQTGWIYAGGSGVYGTLATYMSEGDFIVVQTAATHVLGQTNQSGNGFGSGAGDPSANLTSAPCRIKVWRCGN